MSDESFWKLLGPEALERAAKGGNNEAWLILDRVAKDGTDDDGDAAKKVLKRLRDKS